MMRVLWVTHVYPRNAHDMLGAFLHRLARELPPRGIDVTVLAPGDLGVPEREMRDGVTIIRDPRAISSRPRIAYTGEMHRAALSHPFAFARFIGEFAAATARVVREVSPDLVHAHWWFPSGWAAVRDRRPAEAPVVLSVHGTDVRLLGKWAAARPWARRVFGRVHCVLPVSTFLRRRLESCSIRAAFGDPLPMPADESIFTEVGAPTERTGLVVAARLTRQKRVDAVIRSWSAAFRRGARGTLHVAGDGPERGRLVRLAGELGCASAVEFHGAVSPIALASLFREASAATLASREEGYGLVLVEAALCGTPAIAVRSGALPEVVQANDSGWVVDEDDEDALASAMIEATTRSEVSRARGQAARETAISRTSGPLADRLVAIYRELARNVGGSARID